MIDEHLGAARDCRNVNIRAGLESLDTANDSKIQPLRIELSRVMLTS